MCKERPLHFNTTVQKYVLPQKVVIDNLCNSITVRNAGNSLLIFDDEVIQPGANKVIGGNRLEIFIGRKDISFQPTTNQDIPVPQPTPRVDVAYVTQKFYIRESLEKAGCLDNDGL